MAKSSGGGRGWVVKKYWCWQRGGGGKVLGVEEGGWRKITKGEGVGVAKKLVEVSCRL